MTKPSNQSKLFERFNNEATQLVAVVQIYTAHPISEHRDAILRLLDYYYTLIPKESLRWYCNENMELDKPCTNRTFTIPKAWWRDNVKRKEFRFLQIRDGEAYNSVPTRGVRISCDEYEIDEETGEKSAPWQASQLRFIFPASWAIEQPDRLFEVARRVCEEIPVTSGYAGFGIEINRYFEDDGIQKSYPLAMRYQNADIDFGSTAPDAFFEHLQSINWLTLIGEKLWSRVNGSDVAVNNLPAGITLHNTPHGVILQAGPSPRLDDINRGEFLPEYRELYKRLEPLFAKNFGEAFSFNLGSDDDEGKTDSWYYRFAKSGVHDEK